MSWEIFIILIWKFYDNNKPYFNQIMNFFCHTILLFFLVTIFPLRLGAEEGFWYTKLFFKQWIYKTYIILWETTTKQKEQSQLNTSKFLDSAATSNQEHPSFWNKFEQPTDIYIEKNKNLRNFAVLALGLQDGARTPVLLWKVILQFFCDNRLVLVLWVWNCNY